jgi:hypothetical protein
MVNLDTNMVRESDTYYFLSDKNQQLRIVFFCYRKSFSILSSNHEKVEIEKVSARSEVSRNYMNFTTSAVVF